MTKIIYVGNSEFAIGPLDALLDSDHEVSLVVTQEDKVRSRGRLSPSPVKEFALARQIDLYTTDDINDKDSIEKIRSIGADLILVVSFGQFIGKDLLDLFPDRIINIHASILPKYRGASPIQASLYYGDDITGVSIMLIDEGMDTGDILNICTLKIKDDHNYESLSKDLSMLGGKCLVDTIDNFDDLYDKRRAQNDEESSHVGFISKEMGHIDFNESGKDIMNKHKAFYTWPKLYFIYDGENVKIHDFYLEDRIAGYENGQIIKVDDIGLYVNCKDSCIVFTDLQFPNKQRMKVSEYIKGNDIKKIKLN